MAGIRGVRSIWPTKGGKPKKMFTGTDASGPHKAVMKKAKGCSNNLGPKSNSVNASTNQALRHQKHYGKAH